MQAQQQQQQQQEPEHWHICVENNDFEINDIYPYDIRKIGKVRTIAERVDNSKGGYVFVYMNGKYKRKHVIVAKQFIPNDDPTHKTQVDHINGDRTDYHIENLRWTTHSENMMNVHTHNGVAFEYVDELPDDSEELTQYGKHELDGYYINNRRKAVYRQITDNRYRKLKLLVSGGSRRYYVTTTEGKHIQIAYKQLFG